jgi:hypothetical protein
MFKYKAEISAGKTGAGRLNAIAALRTAAGAVPTKPFGRVPKNATEAKAQKKAIEAGFKKFSAKEQQKMVNANAKALGLKKGPTSTKQADAAGKQKLDRVKELMSNKSGIRSTERVALAKKIKELGKTAEGRVILKAAYGKYAKQIQTSVRNTQRGGGSERKGVYVKDKATGKLTYVKPKALVRDQEARAGKAGSREAKFVPKIARDTKAGAAKTREAAKKAEREKATTKPTTVQKGTPTKPQGTASKNTLTAAQTKAALDKAGVKTTAAKPATAATTKPTPAPKAPATTKPSAEKPIKDMNKKELTQARDKIMAQKTRTQEDGVKLNIINRNLEKVGGGSSAASRAKAAKENQRIENLRRKSRGE